MALKIKQKRFGYERLLKYPHLQPEEAKIWDRFIEKNPEFFREVEYDVPVGEGREYPESEMPNVKEGLEYQAKKRIDVVGFSNSDHYVIEVRPRAGLSAIGNALGLAELYRDLVGPDVRVVPVIITDEKLPDMEEIASRMGVLLFIA